MRTPLLAAAAAAFFAVSTAGASPFDDAFWKHWGDGRAELATYDLTYPRYDQQRAGTAVTIFVTETFSQEARVKADPGVHAAEDEFPVMKLNLVQDFPTGIYDYNLMTSAFVAMSSRLGRPPGAAAKVSFSSQEWCGHVWHQILPQEDSIDHQMHSYFDGEADQTGTTDYPENGTLEDGVLHWARGFAAPFLDPGETRRVPMLRSVEVMRLRHVPLEWEDAALTRSEGTREVQVPAGVFDVETMTVELSGGRSWEILVERDSPRRIIRWSTADGRLAELVASERLQYWRMNGNRFEESLAQLGLSPRPPRTP